MKFKLLSLVVMLTKLIFYGTLIQVFTFSVLLAFHSDAQIIESIKDKELDLNLKNVSLLQAFNELEKNTGYEFTYDRKILKSEVKVDLVGKNLKVYDYLLILSKEANLHFKQYNNNISVIRNKNNEFESSVSITIQDLTVTGRITSSEDGEGLPGVNVTIKGTTQGSVTDVEGYYKLDVPDENVVLVFSSVGYLTEEINVGTQSVIDLNMTPDVTALSEIVVTAFGLEREKKALGYAVQELEGEEMTASREINIANYLTGKVAGVQISNPASGTGGSASVTIRGNSSLVSSNQPLYVVDGVPISNNGMSSGGTWEDKDYGDGIGNINPEDVESLSVLKGPAASALYGSRGANGVILITTKSGTSQKGIGVEFNSTTSIETLNLVPKTQNQYGLGYEGTNMFPAGQDIIDGKPYDSVFPVWLNDSWGPPLDGRRVISDPYLMPGEDLKTRTLLPEDPNNVRDFWETGLIANNMLSFSGGTDNTTARLSIGNTYTKGITPNHKGNRNTFNLRVNSKLTDKLSFDGKINYTNTKFEGRPTLGTIGNPARLLAIMGRMTPMDFLNDYYKKTGEPGKFPGSGNGNPFYIVNEITNSDERNRMIGFASLKYEFTDWLSLVARTGVDWYDDSRERIWPVGSIYPYNTGRVLNSTAISKEINSDFLLTATGDLSADLAGSFSVGGNRFTRSMESSFQDSRELRIPGVYNVTNAGNVINGNSLSEKEIQSLYFMGQLAYKNYLFMDITGRNDWSSALGINDLSFFYPSISLSYVFTDAFEINSDILTFGKLRASWAQVGNDTDPYETQMSYNLYTNSYNGQGYADLPTELANVNLKNELTESWEVGFDLRFFNNRVGLDVTYYDGKTTNQIVPIQLSTSSGFSNAIVNAGEIRNNGIEITLNANVISSGKGFNWDVNFNYAKNNSEVVELVPGLETLSLVTPLDGVSIEARPGEPYGDIVGFKYKRSPDGRKIVSEGGAYVKEDEVSVLGNITPDWVGGLNNTFSYKGFRMNVLVDFVQGGELFSRTKKDMTAKGTGLFTLEGRRPRDTDDDGAQLPYVGILDGVTEDLDGFGNVIGYSENTQAVNGQTYWGQRAWGQIHEEFIFDASYVMLREIMFGYTFNSNMLKNSVFQTIRVSVVGRNLFYLQNSLKDMGISPESAPNRAAFSRGFESFSIPTTRTFGLNVNLTF